MPTQDLQLSECRCQGTGYLSWKQPDNYPIGEVEFCDCVAGEMRHDYWQRVSAQKKSKQLASMFEGAGIPQRFQSLTIDSLEAYGDTSKGSAIAAARSLVRDGYIDTPQGPKNGLVLAGSYGAGKTGLLTPVLRHWLDAGKTGLWVEVYDFIDSIQHGYSDGSSDGKLDAAMRADVILLDDLGDASRDRPETDDKRSIMYRLINYRHGAGLPMLITTNLSGAELSTQFGPRTFERIVEACAWVKMAGKNMRMEV